MTGVQTCALRSGLQAALIAQVVGAAIAVSIQLSFVYRLRIGRPQVDGAALRALLGGGFGFVVLEIVASM